MDIEILSVADCPNLDQARQHVDAALLVLGMAADVRITEVSDGETAARVRMRGSPTVVIDGRDAVATDAAEGSLSCRLYPSADGMRGAPTVDQLVEALTR